jgi:hypothetical protein
MIDMRSDMGEVQHDGFEYNWTFRNGKWRAEVGFLSSGGWVRRRRWVRLMMRPARAKQIKSEIDESHLSPQDAHAESSRPSLINTPKRTSIQSLPLSTTMSLSEISFDPLELDVDNVWRGDSAEQDWARCHAAMKLVSRDGKKLELWKRWLEQHIVKREMDINVKGKQAQPSDNNPMQPSRVSAQNNSNVDNLPLPTIEHITAVLRIHVGISPRRSYRVAHPFYRVTHFSHCSYTRIPVLSSLHSLDAPDFCRT